jgi:pimeloyl-ACP methyl ester carboxylesterase
MKKYFRYLTLFLLFGSSCMTPYSKYPRIQKIDELTYPFATQKLRLDNGIEIAYTEQGNGKETLIFIHGLASYMPAWKKNLETLSKTYRCIAIDLPGYGKSSKGTYDGSMDFYATSVAAFAQKLQLNQFWLVGHSMGGQISLYLTLKYPQQVKGLVLAAPAGFETFHEGEKQWFREAVTARGVMLTPTEQIIANFGSNFHEFPKDAAFMITDRLAMRKAKDFDAFCYTVQQSVQGMVNTPVFDRLPQITQPVLVMYGENDNLIPNKFLHGGTTKAVAQSGVSQLKNATLKMMPRAGHFVQWEAATAVNQAILDFVK